METDPYIIEQEIYDNYITGRILPKDLNFNTPVYKSALRNLFSKLILYELGTGDEKRLKELYGVARRSGNIGALVVVACSGNKQTTKFALELAAANTNQSNDVYIRFLEYAAEHRIGSLDEVMDIIRDASRLEKRTYGHSFNLNLMIWYLMKYDFPQPDVVSRMAARTEYKEKEFILDNLRLVTIDPGELRMIERAYNRLRAIYHGESV